MITRLLSAAVVVAGLLVAGTPAQAAEIRVLASNGVKAAVEALRPQFERASGDTLAIDFSTSATLKGRIDKGEAFDVAILSDDLVDALIASRALTSSMRTELARVGIGVGYRQGAAKPDVRTAESIKQALLHASSIAYTGDGASRPGIDRMIAKLGIARELTPKTHLTAAGASPASVASGASELALTLISEILPVPGVALAGPLPPEFQSYIGFSAAVGAKSGKAPAARALITFLDASAADAVYASKGMEAR